MSFGFDSAWCRASLARATPNEAVPLPAWGGLGNPSRLKFPVGRSIGTPAGKSALSPDGDIITIAVSVLALNYPVPPRCPGLRQTRQRPFAI